MTKKLPANRLQHPNLAGQQHSFHVVILPPGDVFEDLFSPGYWSHHDRSLRQLDFVRAIAADNSFDVMLTCRSKLKGGAVMEPWPKFPPGMDAIGTAAAEIANKARPTTVDILPSGKVAVRVEFVGASKWRVIAQDQQVLVAGLETEMEATVEMNKYLRALGLSLPSPEAIEAAKAKIQAVREEDVARRKARKDAA